MIYQKKFEIWTEGMTAEQVIGSIGNIWLNAFALHRLVQIVHVNPKLIVLYVYKESEDD